MAQDKATPDDKATGDPTGNPTGNATGNATGKVDRRARELVERLLKGEKRAAARLITHMEDATAVGSAALRQLWPHTGKAWLLGVTGPPGAGKSTLVEGLAQQLTDRGRKVGILAVDPSSPFTGGALLGDRLRMSRAAGTGIFIRSMSTRGHLGGLAVATHNAARVLDAMGCDLVIIETVGAGQAEVEVVEVAHTVLVVMVPGLGDEIQALKAGILEIADAFVINKADRPGVERLERELKQLLDLDSRPREWTPPILPTVATTGQGLPETVDSILEHSQQMRDSGALDQREVQHLHGELLGLARQRLLKGLLDRLDKGTLQGLTERVQRREIDPLSAVDLLLQEA